MRTIEGFQRPFSTLLLNENELLVADFVARSVILVDLKTNSRDPIESPVAFSGPHSLAFSHDKKWIFITDYLGKKILKYSANLKFDSVFLQHDPNSWKISGPATTRIDDDGNLFVSDYGSNSIQKYSSNGNFIAWLGDNGSQETGWHNTGSPQVSKKIGGFDRVHDIAFDNEGDFYVADTWNKRVQKYSKDGNFLKHIEGDFVLPVAVDRSQNYLVVSDVGLHSLQIFDISGTYIKTIEGFNKPYDVRWANDLLWVSDSDNQRIQMIPSPVPLS